MSIKPVAQLVTTRVRLVSAMQRRRQVRGRRSGNRKRVDMSSNLCQEDEQLEEWLPVAKTAYGPYNMNASMFLKNIWIDAS